MIRHFLKSAAILLLVFLLTSSVYASAKMEVPLGQIVTLQTDTGTAGDSYRWVAKKGRDIISTQTGAIFTYTFDVQGEYEISLSATDRSGATRNTTVNVLVGNRYTAPTGTGSSATVSSISTPLSVAVATLPNLTSEQTVHIAGNEGRVVFDIVPRPDILEYRIDRNVFVDSDGNGIANDDIDNADHSSYLLGGTWETLYKATDSNKITAEVTVVNTQGQKAKTQAEIIFGSLPDKEGNAQVILDTLPVTDISDKKIYVYGDVDTVAFYPRRSQGDIVEYRIDKNIFVDSDGDGNPSNDIDNRNDTSFRNGDVWVTDYVKTGEQIIAQLIVVGSGGSGSRIQREIVFTDAPVIEYDYEEAPAESSVIQLKADKEFVQKGDPVLFTVEGLAQSLDNYVFEWDFNGDGAVDQSVEGDNKVSYIYDVAEIYPVKVRVMDLAGNAANFDLDFLVKETTSTKADFEYAVEGLTVNFSNLSEVSQNLSSQILTYTWNFGDTDSDNYEAQRDKLQAENPSYLYVLPGTYVVTLTVVDSDQVADTKVTEINVEAPEGYVAPGEEGAESPEVSDTQEGGSVLGAIFKVVLYILLIVIVLAVLIVSGLLVFLKVQHPDLVFEELVDELKLKILGMMGIHDMIEPVQPVTQPAPAPNVTEPDEEPEPDLTASNAPMPDWLKPKPPSEPVSIGPSKQDVIEGELVEESAPKASPAPDENLSKTDGPVPDWLKPQ